MATSDEPEIHRLFGLDLASSFPFKSRLSPGAAPSDLRFECSLEAPPGAAAAADPGPPVYASPHRTSAGASVFSLHRLQDVDLLRYTGVADFHLGADRIACHLLAPEHDYLVELRLLGPVLAYWLERSSVSVLHGSAVAVDGRAAVFLARAKGGKSSLVATLMARGHSLLTDDLLAVEPSPDGGFQGRPSYPQMRLWPEQTERFLGNSRGLPLVHPAYSKLRIPVGEGGFGRFARRSIPLAAIYLPELRAARARPVVEPVSPSAGLVELLRHSFLPRLVEAAGWSARRFGALSRVAESVPFRRLAMPDDVGRLEEAGRAVLADLAALLSSAERGSGKRARP